jgi:ribokinase
MYDIITVGSALRDIFIDTGLKEIKKKDRTFIAYPLGYKIEIKDMKFSIGGGGINTAVGFSKMGLKTAYLGKIGNDESSYEILEELKKAKVKFIGKQENAITGHSIILDSYEHDRTILTYKGPSNELKFTDVKLNELKTKWIYFASSTGNSLKTQEKLAKFAGKNNIKIAFNPSEYEVKLGLRKLKPILSRTNVLIFNKDEAERLTGKKQMFEIFRILAGLGIETICITDGANEINVYHKNKTIKLQPKKIKVVDMTGAGDAFASGFLSVLIRTNDINLSLKAGIANSQSEISYYGTKNKLLTYNEVLKKIK